MFRKAVNFHHQLTAMVKARNFLSFFALVLCVQVMGQAPGLQWQRMIGGTKTDWVKAMARTTDGNYILAGYTESTNYDVTCYNPASMGYGTMWIVKINAAGAVIWQRCAGGPQGEDARKVVATPDGGFIVGGTVNANGGDVTGFHGVYDIWVVKFDGGGNIQWQRCYGGSKEEELTDLQYTSDGGYIFSGWTNSTDGDISGPPPGNGDGWVVKINSAGNIEWSRRLLGTLWDVTNSVTEIPGGGYLAAGYRQSTDGDFAGMDASKEAFVVKFDNTGQLINTYLYGGPGAEQAHSIVPTSDGNFLVAAQANGNGGDVSGVHEGISWKPYDVWVLKINSSGQLLWQKCYGGLYNEEEPSIIETSDGNFAFTSTTGSSDGDVTGFHGNRYWVLDSWVVKASGTDGTIIWQRAFGGASNDEKPWDVVETADGSMMAANWSRSYDGDIQGHKGDFDYWIIKTGPVNTIKGTVYIDANGNGIKDAGEKFYTGMVTSVKGSLSYTTTLNNGLFIHNVDTGSYTTSVIFPQGYYSVNPVSYSFTYTSYTNVDSVSFALVPVPGAKDLAVSVTPVTAPNPGFSANCIIYYNNKGIDAVTPTIRFIKDPRTNYVGASVLPTSVNNDTLTWQLAALQSQDSGSVQVYLTVKTPPTVQMGDTLEHECFIDPTSSDVHPQDNYVLLKQAVVSSFDPNDKQESHAGRLQYTDVLGRDYLNYVIRFQNTGTAGAINVVVRDTLDNKLDLESFEMTGASHPYSLIIHNKNRLEWVFRDIYLPDSNSNEPASHGFISFRIKPKSTLVTGDVVQNSASIYFDFNLPVKTNTVLTEVVSAAALPVQLTRFEGVLHNGVVKLSWKTATEVNTKVYEIERSVDGVNFVKIGVRQASGAASYLFSDASPATGHNYYRLKMIDEDGRYSYSTIVVINTKKSALITSAIYPNPSPNGIISVNINGKINGFCRIDVLDLNGRQVLGQVVGFMAAESYSTTLNLGRLLKGMYLVRITAGDVILSHKAVTR
jgi:uncharacterized repeat protein (TIGR01451 family)